MKGILKRRGHCSKYPAEIKSATNETDCACHKSTTIDFVHQGKKNKRKKKALHYEDRGWIVNVSIQLH